MSHIKNITAWGSATNEGLQAHLNAFKNTLLHLWKTPGITFLTWLTIGITLSFPLFLYLSIQNLTILSERWDLGRTATLYFVPGTTDLQAQTVMYALQHQPEVKTVRYLSAESALEELKMHSDLDAILASLPENPLSPVLTIQPQPGLTVESLRPLMDQLAQRSEIAEIAVDWDWMTRLESFSKLLFTWVSIISILLCLGVVLVVGRTIRLLLEKHQDEFKVHAQLGATRAYIQRPFLYRGALYGIGGAIVAYALVLLSLYFMTAPAQALAQLYATQFQWHLLPLNEVGLFVSWCLFLGWAGAFFTVRRQMAKVYAT